MKRKERIPDAIYERGYVYNFHFHLIWVTKYRNPAFTTPELVQEMKDILLRIAQLNDVTVEELEVMPEHVHMPSASSQSTRQQTSSRHSKAAVPDCSSRTIPRLSTISSGVVISGHAATI